MNCMIDGDPASKVLVIAMAPGREELQADKPLVGASGKLTWKYLAKKAGISRADCYIINTIGEWPEGINGSPTKAQFHKYWDLFDEALARSEAKVAILLGSDALWRFTGLTGIEDWRGYVVGPDDCVPVTRMGTRMGVYKTSNSKRGIKKGDPKVEKFKVVGTTAWPETLQWVIPTLHPSAIMRTGYGTLPVFSADCGRLGRALHDRLELEEPRWEEGAFYNAGSGCVFDIETGGIDNESLTRIGYAPVYPKTAIRTAVWDGQARDALKDAFSYGSPSVAFNIAFDAPRLAKHGVEVPEPWWDVMLAAALAKPDLKKSLNYVSSLYLDIRRWKHLSEDEPAKYNALDVDATRRLYYVLKEELERTNQLDLFERRMMPSVPTLVRMTSRGIRVDTGHKARWIDELTQQMHSALGEWEALAPGMKTSGKNLLRHLYYDLGIPVQYSKHGGESSEVAGLKKLLITEDLEPRQRATIETLLRLRGIQKELKTYAEVDVTGDGCIHPGFLPAGKDTDAFGKGIAGTGRPTSSRPNIQNQTQSARRMYIPHSSGQVLLEADFSQIEARIIAQLSGDEVLANAIAEGLHESNQRAMGVDKTRAKNGFYGWAYGAGKRTLSRTFISHGYEVSERECEQLLRGFDERFRKTAAWRRRVAAEVSNTYYLSNAFGRRRYFMGGSRDVPAGLDYHPQSCAADIMWTVLRQLEDRLRGIDASLLATVHDSVLLECARGSEGTCSQILRDVMEQPWSELGGLVVPIEIKTGENWGEMKPYEIHSNRNSA